MVTPAPPEHTPQSAPNDADPYEADPSEAAPSQAAPSEAAPPQSNTGPTSHQVFDRKLVAQRRARAARKPAHDHFLRTRIVQDMIDRLCAVNRHFPVCVEIGGTGSFARATRAPDCPIADKIDHVIPMDIHRDCAAHGGLVADEERLPIADASVDLIVSPLCLHAVNDVPGALVQIRRALKPDGLFIGALFGGASLTELRTCLREAESAITGGAGFRIAPMADALDLSQLLQRAGFTLPVSDMDRVAVRYANPMTLLADLRAMGETAAMVDRARRPLRRDVVMDAMARYQAQYADPDGKCRASFDIIWATGWAEHESQQKPLKPGSAKMRLADALNTTEHSAGEKARRV